MGRERKKGPPIAFRLDVGVHGLAVQEAERLGVSVGEWAAQVFTEAVYADTRAVNTPQWDSFAERSHNDF